jgi:hypothetical protein
MTNAEALISELAHIRHHSPRTGAPCSNLGEMQTRVMMVCAETSRPFAVRVGREIIAKAAMLAEVYPLSPARIESIGSQMVRGY